MTKGILVLVRHGQSVDNIKRLMTGHNDVPLTKTGEEQARAAGLLIKDIKFDKVYSSPLGRAFNTAALALKAAGQDLPIEKRNELLEGDAGKFAGRSMDNDPEVKKFVRFYDTPMPGGESDKQLVARVQKLFDEEIWPRLRRGEKVVVFSHSGTTRAAGIPLGLAQPPQDGMPWKRTAIPNATPLVYEVEGDVVTKAYVLENPVTEKANKPPAKPADKFKP